MKNLLYFLLLHCLCWSQSNASTFEKQVLIQQARDLQRIQELQGELQRTLIATNLHKKLQKIQELEGPDLTPLRIVTFVVAYITNLITPPDTKINSIANAISVAALFALPIIATIGSILDNTVYASQKAALGQTQADRAHLWALMIDSVSRPGIYYLGMETGAWTHLKIRNAMQKAIQKIKSRWLNSRMPAKDSSMAIETSNLYQA